MMKSPIILSIFLMMSMNPAFSQGERDVVRKKVLIAMKYIDDLEAVLQKETSEDGEKIITINMAGDIYFYEIMPYETPWPMETYLRDLHAKPYNYLYNDVFVYNHDRLFPYDNDLIEMEIDTATIRNKPVLNIPALADANNIYLVVSNIGSVAKIWEMDAEWETHTVDFKPNRVKGMTSRNLVFDEYHIHVLHRILDIKPIETIDETRTSARAVKNVELRLKSKD